jgi:hypothetical protein
MSVASTAARVLGQAVISRAYLAQRNGADKRDLGQHVLPFCVAIVFEQNTDSDPTASRRKTRARV